MKALTEEQRKAWIDEALPECLAMNYKIEQACTYFINELVRHLRIHPTQIRMYVTMHSDRIETTVECQTAMSRFSMLPDVCFIGRGNRMSYQESIIVAFCELMISIAAKWFYTDMTARMFLLYLEHYTADLDGFIANNKPNEFFASLADAWRSIGSEHSISTGIHDATTCGYGVIDNCGFWFIPLHDAPDHVIVRQPEES